MKQYTRIIITGSPAYIKRFNRWLKSRYNVNYPDREERFDKLGIVSIRWTIKYHDNWFLGNSEEALNIIATYAEREHARHTRDNSSASWDIYSE